MTKKATSVNASVGATGKKSLSLSDLTSKRKLTELFIPALDGSVYLRPMRAGFVLDQVLATGALEAAADAPNGKAADVRQHNESLLAMMLESVVDESNQPIFSSREDVLAVGIDIYNTIAGALLAMVNPKAVADVDALGKGGASGAGSSTDSPSN